MNRYPKYFTILIGLAFICQPVLAFDSKSLVKIDSPYATFYPGTFDNLVLDFSVITVKSDALKAVSLKNLGTADELSQIKNLTLWADAGSVGFQGLGIDHYLGYLNHTGDGQNWYLDNLNARITDSQRFFVSAEFYTYFLNQAGTIQMQIPKLSDSNGNASFDLGDLGVFMDSGDNGPTDLALTNANTQVISASVIDSQGPKIILTNLADNQVINNNHFTILGIAKDQGNSGVSDLNIIIDNLAYPITTINLDNWEYDWRNISDGSHAIKVTAQDQVGNAGQSDKITITAQNQVLSLTNSSASIDRAIIKNDGLDKAIISVKLKDINQQAISNRQVNLEGSDIIAPSSKITDQNGEAVFEVRSSFSGTKILTLNSEGQVLAAFNLTVNSSGADINSGDLIKVSTPAVYYYGADGKRYVFPNVDIYKSWYSDFKNVKTITDSQLASIPLGANVTYKPGLKLVKITTDSKVYAVDLGGTLRWIKTEAAAKSLYGSNWVSKITDVSDANFGDYKMGTPIEKAGDFDVAQAKEVLGINEDKGL